MSGVWAPERRALTTGLVLTITLVAFESLAVATILPDVEADLGGLSLYGWVFSAFFLGSLVGVVVAGQTTDHRGPAAAYLLGLGLFVGGLVLGGLAPSMFVLVVARAVQGFGAGAVPATAYATIGRAYPEAIRPRVFAILSTAWVVPGLLGPGAAGAISHAVGWRWVFLGLVPLSLVAGLIAYRPLRALAVEDGVRAASRLGPALRVAIGAGLVLGGITADRFVVAVPLVAAGAMVGVRPFLSLVPPGTVRAAPGLPAAVLVRGVLTFAFFGADAYIPLAITSARGATTLYAGLALTVSAVFWTAGSWFQERLVNRVGPRRFVGAGHLVMLAGIGGAALILWDAVPLWVVVVAWAIAGFGIGMSYAPISLTVLREAPPGQEGTATAGMQLTDLLGVSLGTGFGGAAVGLGDTLGWGPTPGIGIAWGMAAAAALAGAVIARRLPGASTSRDPVLVT
ncbi:MAG TPA: MFS transporter [Acidimicrobiales bacterium]|nr:MFS transporter [Acidimicrobiales bacterium]